MRNLATKKSFVMVSYMDSLLKADIFFVVATIATVVLAAGVVWALIYILRILRNVREISDIADREAKELSRDFGALHDRVRERGITAGLSALWGGRSASKKKRSN